MAIPEYIPQYILTTENFCPKGIVTAEHWNELFNLLISQGNDSAHVLANLINELGVVGVTELVRSADNRMRHVRLNNDGAIEVSSDNVTWEVPAPVGHVILDKNNTILPQRLRLKFTNTTVTDIDGVTVVDGIKGDKGDKGDTGEKGSASGLLPQITITAPIGSNLTVTCGSTTFTATSTTATTTIEVSSYGTWVCGGTYNGEALSTATVSIDTVKQYSATLALTSVYGASWNKLSQTTLTRTDAATLFTNPTPCTGSVAGASPFDSIYPWNGVRACNLAANGTKIYQGESGFSRTPSTGDVMVEIPKYWYKITNNASELKIQIADNPKAGFSISPAHQDRGDGAGVRDFVYVGAYVSDTNYRSVSGVAPKGSAQRDATRAGIHARGDKYWMWDFATWWTINMLYLVEFADWNCQATIGYGLSGAPGVSNSGLANAIGGSDVQTHHTGTAGATLSASAAVKYRNMENLWGNAYAHLDGVNFNFRNTFICLNPAKFASNTSENYTDIGVLLADTSGIIKDWVNGSGVPWALVPASTTAWGVEGNAYCADVFTQSTTAWRMPLTGGIFNSGTYNGLFELYTYFATTEVRAEFVSRIMYLP